MNTKPLHIFALCMVGLCCFGSDESVKYAFSTKWVSYAGGSVNPDAVYALATDVHTNAYFGGVLGSGSLENDDGVFVTDLLSTAGSDSGFVAKADADGTLSWASTLTYERGSTIYGVTSTNGAVYACGLIKNQADVYDDLGNYVSYTWSDAILSSLNSAVGSRNWWQELRFISGVDYYNTTNAYRSVAVDASGNIYAVGYTTITNLPSSSPYAGGKDVVIAKYEPNNGDLVWVRYLGGVNDDEANAVSIGKDGLYVSGTTRSPHWITLGTNTLPSVSNSYGFLAKLAFLDGAVTYTTVLGGNGNDEILSMQTVSNMIYLAGTTYSTNFCNATNQLNKSGGAKDGFVLKLTDYGSTYQTNWFRYVGTNTVDAVQSLALMDSNRVVVCGLTSGSGWMPERDEFSKGYAGGTAGFILQLNRDTGVPIWSTYVGGESNDAVYAVAVCGKSVFLGGTTGSPGWEMFGGFWDSWSVDRIGSEYSETGFVGKWSQEPGVPPVITNDIADVTVHEGVTNVFFFGVSSKISVKYYWFTNGVPTGVSTNRHVIGPARPSDDGTFYQCIASNVFGCATSSVAHLTVIANGMLDVSITPPSAVDRGAVWQLTGGVWRASGAIALYPGTYTVAFTNLTGWTMPATCQVVVVSSQTTTVAAVYLAPVATAVRTINTWTNVSLAVTRPSEVAAWTLVETLPADSTPVNYGAGVWNATARTLAYTGTVSETVGYTVLLGAPNDYTITGSITSMPINVTMPVTGDNRVSRGDFLRKISGTNVWIYMSQPTTIKPWYVYEDLTGTLLQAFNISMAGSFSGGWIYWSGTSIGAGIVLSYSVSGPPGSTNILTGIAGVTFPPPPITYTIYGDNMVIIPMPLPTPPPPPTILSFTFSGASGFLSFTSVVDQAYMVLTNANISVTNGWKNCVPATGQGAITTVTVPIVEPQLFYRVKSD